MRLYDLWVASRSAGCLSALHPTRYKRHLSDSFCNYRTNPPLVNQSDEICAGQFYPIVRQTDSRQTVFDWDTNKRAKHVLRRRMPSRVEAGRWPPSTCARQADRRSAMEPCTTLAHEKRAKGEIED